MQTRATNAPSEPVERDVSESDSFIDEVTEEVRRDKLFAVFRKYAWIGVLAVAAIVGGTTNCGGLVVGGSASVFINGKPMATSGSAVTGCPQN